MVQKKYILLIVKFFLFNSILANSGGSRNQSSLQFQLSGAGGSTGEASIGLTLGYHLSQSFYLGVNSFPQFQSAEFNTFNNNDLSPSTQKPISGSIIKTSIFTDSEKLKEIGFQSKDYKQKGSSHIEIRISPSETSGFYFSGGGLWGASEKETLSTHSGSHKIGTTTYSNTTITLKANQKDYEATPIYGFGWNWIADWGISGGFALYWHTKNKFDLEINYIGATVSDSDKRLHQKEIESYIKTDKSPFRFTSTIGGNF